MRKSIKATLFSALIFPGSGHFLLRKHVRGALLAGISIVCLYILVSSAVMIAQQVNDALLSGQIPLDTARIADEVSRRSDSGDALSVSLATYALLACWLVGIVDAWRVGRAQDRRDDPET